MTEMGNTTDGQSMTVVFKTHFKQEGRRKQLCKGEAPPARAPEPVFRTPRVTRLMALAILLQHRIEEGVFSDYAHIAALSGLTRGRITQIMNLTLLAPRIQEEILFMPKIRSGADPITERTLRVIALRPRWDLQLKEWGYLIKSVEP